MEKVIPLTGYQNISVSFSMGSYSLENENVQALYYNGSSWQVVALKWTPILGPGA
jgi:hypothetical protein